MKKLLAVLAMVVLATPAFAAVQNVKVSGSVTSYFVDRENFDFDANTGYNGTPTSGDTKYRQNFFYTSTHVLISSDLSDNVSAQVGLANEVVWGDQNTYNSASGGGSPTYKDDSSVDLELANVTLREFLYSPLTLTIGRQSFSIGNDFLIGASGNTSVGTMANIANDMSRTINYDGITAVLDYKPLTITGFYLKVNSHNDTGLVSNVNPGQNKDDEDLYGVVANYQLNDPMSTVIEGTFLTQVDNSVNTIAGGKPSTLFVPDLRVSTNPTKDLTIGAEAAGQFGKNYNSSISTTPPGVYDQNESRAKAWAAQASASYNLPVLEKYKPNVTERVTFYSGQDDANLGRTNSKSYDKSTAWNPLLNDQDLGTTIWRSIWAPTNLLLSELSFSASPLEDVTAKITWTDLWLANTTGTATGTLNSTNTGSGLALPDGSTVSPVAKDNKNLGNEIDGVVTYQYTEDVSFGLNLGMFKPGSVFASKNSTTATEAIASVGVNF